MGERLTSRWNLDDFGLLSDISGPHGLHLKIEGLSLMISRVTLNSETQ